MMYSFLHKTLMKKYYAISIYIFENEYEYHGVLLHKKDTTIEVVEEFFAETLETLITVLDKNIPVVLNINGPSVIEKKVTVQEGYLEQILFHKDVNQYYVCELVKEDQITVSIARKKQIDTVLKNFEAYTISVIDFTIGAFVLSYLEPLIQEPLILTKYYTYKSTTSELIYTSEASKNNQVAISEEHLGTHSLIAFASFIAYMSKGKTQRNYEPLLIEFEENFVFNKGLKRIGYAAVIGFFLLLVSSYLIASIYNDKRLGIEAQLQEHRVVLAEITSLKKDIEYKAKVISANSLDSNYYISQFIIDVLNQVPNDIQVDVFEIFPILESRNNNNAIEITSGIIHIKGVTNAQYTVNTWITMLNNLPWVQKTEIDTFDLKYDTFSFTINIYIK